MDKVVLGFSGGVDSAVSAALLREQGFDVYCLLLATSALTAAGEARIAAETMGFPLKVFDAREAMEQHVLRPFAQSYRRGETPNPCILCNRAVKFRLLAEYADGIGANFIATGHYARVSDGGLYKGRPENDQSYMLCRITREQLGRLVLPLGAYRKTEVRNIAALMGLPCASKPDSMEICFIPDGDHASWIETRGEAPPSGDIIFNGKVVGKHEGIHHYTIGQRRGLAFAAGKRVYVSEIRPDTNEVFLSDGEGLFTDTLRAREMNWLADPPESPFPCGVRIRHSRADFPATAAATGDGGAELFFEKPIRAPTRGQSAVLYNGDRLLGGGFIE